MCGAAALDTGLQALDYVAACIRDSIVPRRKVFCQDHDPTLQQSQRIVQGMVTQLHLALVMAIDAKLLVLDEPTLGLDILYRKHSTIPVNDYFDRTAHRGSDTPGGRDANVLTMSCSSTAAVSYSTDHGRSGVALCGSGGAPEKAAGTGAPADDERRCSVAASCCSIASMAATRRAWRCAHAQHRDCSLP